MKGERNGAGARRKGGREYSVFGSSTANLGKGNHVTVQLGNVIIKGPKDEIVGAVGVLERARVSRLQWTGANKAQGWMREAKSKEEAWELGRAKA